MLNTLLGVGLVFLLIQLFKGKIRHRTEQKIDRLRKQESAVGDIFHRLAMEKQQAIRCLVYARHYPWGKGYRIRLTALGEPDTILAVTVNCWRRKSRMIEIEGYPSTFYSLDQKSQEKAVEEWEGKLNRLIRHN